MRLVVEFDLRTIRVHTFIGIGCIFFCGLTPIGKTSNKWVSSQAKFKLEVNQGVGSYVHQEKSAQRMKEAQIITQGAS